MRVGILCLMQESNTFIQNATLYRHFEEDMLLEGGQIRDALEDAHHEVGGFFRGLVNRDWKPSRFLLQELFPLEPFVRKTFLG